MSSARLVPQPRGVAKGLHGAELTHWCLSALELGGEALGRMRMNTRQHRELEEPNCSPGLYEAVSMMAKRALEGALKLPSWSLGHGDALAPTDVARDAQKGGYQLATSQTMIAPSTAATMVLTRLLTEGVGNCCVDQC